jgi:hypothetical protein
MAIIPALCLIIKINAAVQKIHKTRRKRVDTYKSFDLIQKEILINYDQVKYAPYTKTGVLTPSKGLLAFPEKGGLGCLVYGTDC